MNIPESRQLTMVKKPFGMMHCSPNRVDTRRNKFVVPLMPVRPVTGGTTSSNQFAARRQSESVSRANLDSTVYVGNSGVLVDSSYQSSSPTSSHLFMVLPASSCNARRGNSNCVMSLQDGVSVSMPRAIEKSLNSSSATSSVQSNANNKISKQNKENTANYSYNFKVFGSTEREKIFIFTGTVERVIKWNKIFQNHFCYYEVIASVVSIQEGSVNTQKIMLLRDKKGPILQVIYYLSTHIDIEDFHVEQVLRCVGRMSAPNVLNAISIRAATQEEMVILQRLCLVCDHAISHFLSI